GEMDGLFVLVVDARPDDMAMLPAVLDVVDDGPRLAFKPERFLHPVDIVHVLRPRQLTLPEVRVDREAVEIVAALGETGGDGLPLGEGPVQIRRNRARNLRHLDKLVVERVQQMGGEVFAAAALARLGYHGERPSARRQAARISRRSRTASSSSAASASAARPFRRSFSSAVSASRRATSARDADVRRAGFGEPSPNTAAVMNALTESPDSSTRARNCSRS